MSNTRETGPAARTPQLGTIVKDTGEPNGIGIVMGYEGPYVQLRPVSGGKEWDAVPSQVRPLTAREELSVRLAERNEWSRWGT
ncbi:hypothetical protein [Streptomyces sp. NPDC048639]|uniref:hypothetical protein n=1 Tax=Streptomyces sp. NPDC048639 TaxID=3365581 RepID=UPI0037130DFF